MALVASGHTGIVNGDYCGSLVGFVSRSVDVRDVIRRTLHRDVGVVNFRTICGVERMDLTAIRCVDLAEIFNPAEAGEAAVVIRVQVLIRVRNGRATAQRHVGHDVRGAGTRIEQR